jgi:hypothetical protein
MTPVIADPAQGNRIWDLEYLIKKEYWTEHQIQMRLPCDPARIYLTLNKRTRY